jgi:hypothetical protein
MRNCITKHSVVTVVAPRRFVSFPRVLCVFMAHYMKLEPSEPCVADGTVSAQ